MSGDRSERALARIEAALARIEGAARQPRSSGDDGELDRLRGRHERLRAAVSDSLVQLDTLIAGPRG
jgi:hypothetical protein